MDSCCARWLQERSYRIGPPPPACPKTLRGHLYWSHGWSAQPRSHSPRLAARRPARRHRRHHRPGVGELRQILQGRLAAELHRVAHCGVVDSRLPRQVRPLRQLQLHLRLRLGARLLLVHAERHYHAVGTSDRLLERPVAPPQREPGCFGAGQAGPPFRQGHGRQVENPAVGHHKITQCQGYLVMVRGSRVMASCRCRRVRVAASVWPRVALVRYLLWATRPFPSPPPSRLFTPQNWAPS